MSKHLHTFTLAWVISVFVALVINFIWALDRGFEITDESFYVLLAMHPEAVKLFSSAQHWLTSSLWLATGNLCWFRASGLFVLLFSAAILAKGSVHAYIRSTAVRPLQARDMAIVYACFMTGALLYGATINFSPCYNLLSSATTYAAIGLTLLAVGHPATNRARGCHLLAGCLLGIAILNKLPAGLALSLVVFALVAVFGTTPRDTVAGGCNVLLGLLATTIAFIGYHRMTENVLDEFQFGVAVFKTVQTENNATRLLRYVSEISTQMFWCGAWVTALAACLVKYPRTAHLRRYAPYAIVAIVVLGCIHLPAAFKTHGFVGMPDLLARLTANRWVGVSDLLATLTALALTATVNVWTRNFRSIVLTMTLFALPYAAGAGTGNPINTQIVIALASWGGAIAILTLSGNDREERHGTKKLACGLFVSVIAVQVAVSNSAPYHLNASIWKQTVPTEIGRIGTVKTDQATHDFITSLTDIREKHNLDGGQPYLGFYDVPGIALIIDTVPVFIPWLVNQKHAECMLGRADSDLLRSTILGIRLGHDGSGPALPRQFADFPRGLTKAGEATCPYGDQTIQIWIPNPL